MQATPLHPPPRPLVNTTATVRCLSAKPHYEILDGLRGVAALLVVFFHLFEPHSGGDVFRQVLNHGYLAVDFFFLLSGFVLGYAYDDRWGRMTYLDFLRRRLIRLQPLVILGTLLGAACFYWGASAVCPAIATTPFWKLLAVAAVGLALIPIPVSWDIRGWAEMYPLNGPAWSLFFEYIANAAYALVLRRLGVRTLAVLTAAAGAATIHYLFTSPRADLIGGWELTPGHLAIGFTRLAYPFLAGLLLHRLGRKIRIPHGFWVCSAALLVLLAAPRLGDRAMLWPNALYESMCIILLFPLLVAAGAGSALAGKRSRQTCLFLGRLSYPIYVTHFPIVYLYTVWAIEKQVSIREALPVFAATLVAIIAISYLSLRFYDEPLRTWLARQSRRD